MVLDGPALFWGSGDVGGVLSNGVEVVVVAVAGEGLDLGVIVALGLSMAVSVDLGCVDMGSGICSILSMKFVTVFPG